MDLPEDLWESKHDSEEEDIVEDDELEDLTEEEEQAWEKTIEVARREDCLLRTAAFAQVQQAVKDHFVSKPKRVARLIQVLAESLIGYPALISRLALWMDRYLLPSERLYPLIRGAEKPKASSASATNGASEASKKSDEAPESDGPGHVALLGVLTDELLSRYTPDGGYRLINVRCIIHSQAMVLENLFHLPLLAPFSGR